MSSESDNESGDEGPVADGESPVESPEEPPVADDQTAVEDSVLPPSETDTQAVKLEQVGEPDPAVAPPVAPQASQGGAGPDAVGILAHVLFIAIGGLLVFGFAYALWPAVEVQNDGPCRAMKPNVVAYTPLGIKLGESLPGEGLPDIDVRPAPELTLERLDGTPVSLSDYAGKLVVLNFWASWCEPCLREWPELDKLARRLGDRDDVVILAVSLDKAREDIEPYLLQAGLGETPVEVVFDPTGEANKIYGSDALPDTFFIDREGQLIGAFVNVREWGKPHAFRCVDATIAMQ